MLVFKKGADTEGITELPDTRLTVFTANLDKPPHYDLCMSKLLDLI